MGVIHAKISNKLNIEFRQEVLNKYGPTRGAISKAVEDALKLWIKKGGNK